MTLLHHPPMTRPHPEAPTRRWAALLLAVLVAAVAPRVGVAQEDTRPQCTEQRDDTLEGRNCLFLRALGRGEQFFPRTGTFTYLHTAHRPGGGVVILREAPRQIC
jgi:hypothetical protein